MRAPWAPVLGQGGAERAEGAVVVSRDLNNASVLLGRGDGTLQVGLTTTIINSGSFVLPLDFDKDGILDIAIAAPTGRVATYTGKKDGTFTFRTTYMTGLGSQHVAAGHLNGDNFDDLVVSGVQAGKFTVLLGAANGAFLGGVDYQTAGMPAASGIADLDGDGILDIATGTFNLGQIFRGQGDGTFVLGPSLPVTGNNRCVIPVDIDSDGRIDLAVCNANNLALIPNTSI